ncbi:hypothetical protein [Neobacillus mesonae]|uniref:hypothetical protein n=1 Tax=Neobacillus mesonae TaxID=1193713 RepID=UPI00204025E8|nr:hypothetical protein [Neobacillus mesonae]MCM3568901.1 hypothetical protein [Neobacillus mesonae]
MITLHKAGKCVSCIDNRRLGNSRYDAASNRAFKNDKRSPSIVEISSVITMYRLK